MKPRTKTLEERQAAMKERLTGESERIATGEEEPLTVIQASKIWGQSPKQTRKFFKDKPGVRLVRSTKKRGIRVYVTVLIPPSVMEREIKLVTNKN